MAEPLTLSVAFFAGVVAFVTPCVLPLIPAYMSHLSGTTVEELQKNRSKRLQMKVFFNSAFFVLGFSSVFVLAGLALISIAQLFPNLQIWFLRAAGTVIILFGLQTMGLINLPFLGRQHSIRLNVENKGYMNSGVMGAAFGAGWTPCVGPILGAIFGISLATGSIGDSAGLLAAFSAGLGVPFLVTGMFTSFVAKAIHKVGRIGRIVEIAAGIILVALGIVIFTNSFNKLLSILVSAFPFLRAFFLG